MKKMLSIILLLVILLTILCGCGRGVQSAKCDFCADEKPCMTKTFLGDEVKICDDCQALMGTVFQ